MIKDFSIILSLELIIIHVSIVLNQELMIIYVSVIHTSSQELDK